MLWIILLAVPIIVILGLIGGQFCKPARRFGIPSLTFILSLTDRFQWRDLGWLLLIPALSIGYGENSWLYSVLNSDFWVRIFYGIIVAIPFAFQGWKLFLIALFALPVAFSLHLGGFPLLGYDFLWEDFVRYGILALLVIFSMFRRKE